MSSAKGRRRRRRSSGDTRVRIFVGCLAAGVVGGGLAMQGCGADEDTPLVDAGQDVLDARPRGVTLPDAAEPPCDQAKDLFADARDAAIGDGSSTIGLCLACARTRCEQAIAKCTVDCPCQAIVGDALECYLTTQQIGCAAALANIFVTSETRKDALSLLGCVQTECQLECAFDGGADPDAGGADKDAGEAGEPDAG